MSKTYRTTNNSVDALKNALAFNGRDWGVNKADAWLWGVIIGWDEDAMSELAAHHGWDQFDVANLRRLHDHFESLDASAQARTAHE